MCTNSMYSRRCLLKEVVKMKREINWSGWDVVASQIVESSGTLEKKRL